MKKYGAYKDKESYLEGIMAHILLTGATGFIGRSLYARLISEGHHVKTTSRNKSSDNSTNAYIADIGGSTDWQNALRGVEIVIHLAAQVHDLNKNSPKPRESYHEVNVLGTSNLIQQAVTAHVGRFIYLSSVKVNGEKTGKDPFTEKDSPFPVDYYGISKHKAEESIII